MPLSLLTYHLIGEADQHCKAPELPAPRRSSPHHPNLHRRSVCTEHSSAIQSHLLQNKIYSPGPIQPWRQWHPEQKIWWVEISLKFNSYAIPTIFQLLITDCQPAHTNTPLLHWKYGLEQTLRLVFVWQSLAFNLSCLHLNFELSTLCFSPNSYAWNTL